MENKTPFMIICVVAFVAVVALIIMITAKNREDTLGYVAASSYINPLPAASCAISCRGTYYVWECWTGRCDSECPDYGPVYLGCSGGGKVVGKITVVN